jgi:hypothetical protein
MSIRLGLLELLRNSNTTFGNLYEDLSDSVYQWLNRRELGTDYEALEPLSKGPDFQILAWYVVGLERNPYCMVCGDFYSEQGKFGSVNITSEQLAAFQGANGEQTEE